MCCWVGDIEEGEQFVKPLREFGSPVADLCLTKPFLTHQAMFDPSFVPGRWYYFKSCDVAELTDEIIDITHERSLQIKSPLTSFPIWQMGGAVSKVADDETAVRWPEGGFTFNIGCCTETARGSTRSASGCATSGRRSSRGTVGVRELPRGRGRGAGPRGLRRRIRPAEGSSSATTRTTSSASTRTSRRTSA